MKLVIFIIQYFRIKLRYWWLRNFTSKSDGVVLRLLKDGIVIIPNFFSPVQARELLDSVPRIEEMIVSPEGTETRFSVGMEKIVEFDDFFQNSRIQAIMRYIIGSDAKMLRAVAQRRIVKGEIKSFEQFFHSDTWRHRLKAFLYLTDVDSENAPLVYLPKSHYGFWRFGIDKELWQFTKTKSDTFLADVDSQYAGTLFPHQSSYVLRKLKSKEIEAIGKAGTLVIFDARGLHRSKPLISGDRVILSSYWIKENEHV